jgi:hypothetical protein
MTIAILTSALGIDGMSGLRALKPDVLNSIRLSRHCERQRSNDGEGLFQSKDIMLLSQATYVRRFWPDRAE